MKIRQHFTLQSIGNSQMLVSIGGDDAQFHGIVYCNETAAFVVTQLMNDISKEKLCQLLIDKYSINTKQAQMAVDYVLNQLNSVHALEN